MTVTAPCRRLPMTWLAALLMIPALGCSGGGSTFALNPRRVALREQLSRLEFQNQQLKDELRVAQQEARRLSNDLQLAEIDNKDMQRRLDSFRTQLGLNARGGGPIDPYEPARSSPGNSGSEWGSTRPAAQPPNRAPFTRIPNPSSSAIDVSPPTGPSAEEFFGSRRPPSYDEMPRPYIEPPPVQYFDLSPSAGRAELGLRTRPASSTWSPLARGSASRSRD